jgi:hypothetical protein
VLLQVIHAILQKENLMKKILLIALSFGLVYCTNAQSAKAVFVEAGGPGLASFNFDTRFTGKESGIGGRIGLGGFTIDGEGAVFLPVTLNYIMSKDSTNYFELGAGATFIPSTSAMEEGPFKNTSGHLNFGYRYQPSKGGFFFRATINPVFGKNFFWPYYGGISIGYKF